MIELTGINGVAFYLNVELIYRIDTVPDTVLSLTDGKTLVVSESAATVSQKILAYRQQVHRPILNITCDQHDTQ